MKRKPNDLSRKEFITTLDALYTAASAVRGRDAVKLFLRDLLTPSERVMLGRRILIAKRLLARETYDEIGMQMKVSRTTIAKVEHWLRDQFPGYEKALEGMERAFKKRTIETEINYGSFSFRALKKKYPLHFLLFSNNKRK